VSILYQDLEDAERTLMSRVSASVPRDEMGLERMVTEHREFESRLHTYESRIETVQRNYATIPQKPASLQAKMEKLVDKWENVTNQSSLFTEKLTRLETVLTSLEETRQYVSHFEIKLSSTENLPIEDEGLKRVSEELYNLQNTAQAHQYNVDKMVDETKNVRRLTEKSRGSSKRHPDVEKLEDDVHRTTERWNESLSNVVQRFEFFPRM